VIFRQQFHKNIALMLECIAWFNYGTTVRDNSSPKDCNVVHVKELWLHTALGPVSPKGL
jgi:hypothetical protein